MVTAILEAAVPRGQDIQVLLAQQGKAPAWKRRGYETDTQRGAQREPALSAHVVLPVLCSPSIATLAALPLASLVA